MPSTPGYDRHPYPFHDGCPKMGLPALYDELREAEAVSDIALPDGTPARLVTRYADVRHVLTRQEEFSRAAAEGVGGYVKLGQIMLALDGEEHAAVRAPAARALTPRRVETMRGLARGHAERLAGHTLGAGTIEFTTAFATPYALAIIADLLDVPQADRNWFADIAQAMFNTQDGESAARAQAEIGAALYGYVVQRRAQPGEDLLSEIITDAGDRLTDEDLTWLSVALLAGGIETTASMTAQIVLFLLTHPEHLQQLRAEPDLIPAAVNELLRVLSTGVDDAMPRRATSTVTVAGTLIKEGDLVLASRDAGNHDPEVFPSPHTVDFRRQGPPHLGYGWGPHRCIGASLATVSLEEALAVLLPHLDRLTVDEESVAWKRNSTVRGLEQMMVTLT